MIVKIGGERLEVEDAGLGCVHIWDGASEYDTEVQRKDAWRLALVLLRYAITGRIG